MILRIKLPFFDLRCSTVSESRIASMRSAREQANELQLLDRLHRAILDRSSHAERSSSASVLPTLGNEPQKLRVMVDDRLVWQRKLPVEASLRRAVDQTDPTTLFGDDAARIEQIRELHRRAQALNDIARQLGVADDDGSYGLLAVNARVAELLEAERRK